MTLLQTCIFRAQNSISFDLRDKKKINRASLANFTPNFIFVSFLYNKANFCPSGVFFQYKLGVEKTARGGRKKMYSADVLQSWRAQSYLLKVKMMLTQPLNHVCRLRREESLEWVSKDSVFKYGRKWCNSGSVFISSLYIYILWEKIVLSCPYFIITKV